ncbi:unnamed protein product, partial [Brenthis ino]
MLTAHAIAVSASALPAARASVPLAVTPSAATPHTDLHPYREPRKQTPGNYLCDKTIQGAISCDKLIV